MLFYIFFFILLVYVIYQTTPEAKGKRGERLVSSVLKGLNPNEYILINDIMLKSSYGTTQIDHIVVSVYGIFVIETKNYRGWIIGNEYSDQWTKNVYGKKCSFRNPVMQNYGHIKALEDILSIEKRKFISIIAFTYNAEIKVKAKSHVIYVNELQSVIESYDQKIFSWEDINTFSQKIISSNIESKNERFIHALDIRDKLNENDIRISMDICPRCGGNLIIKNGRYGCFRGCSNYPKCKYTIKK